MDIVGSGVYDNFTISKAVTVAAEPGVLASFDVPASSNGITIATAATDMVTLRRLNLHGQGAGNGVPFGSSGEISVEDCVIANFSSGIASTLTRSKPRSPVRPSVVASDRQLTFSPVQQFSKTT